MRPARSLAKSWVGHGEWGYRISIRTILVIDHCLFTHIDVVIQLDSTRRIDVDFLHRLSCLIVRSLSCVLNRLDYVLLGYGSFAIDVDLMEAIDEAHHLFLRAVVVSGEQSQVNWLFLASFIGPSVLTIEDTSSVA